MLYYLSVGSLLGLSAGVAPGPLLTLVITESLRAGTRAGVAVALAPLLTDVPIVLVSVLALARLAAFENVLGVVSLAGAVFVLWMGYGNLRTRSITLDAPGSGTGALTRGIAVNALSPHPYLFWLGVGAPAVTTALERGPLPATAFVGGFYLLLVGSKILCAVLVSHARAFLAGRGYIVVMRLLGAVLCGLALLLLRDGLRLLAII